MPNVSHIHSQTIGTYLSNSTCPRSHGDAFTGFDCLKPSPSPGQMVLKACQTNDVSLISQALILASSPDSRVSVQGLLTQAVRQSIRRNSTNVLAYVLEHGAEVPAYSSLSVEDPCEEIPEILVTHGWDINARGIGDRPFLWDIVRDSDLVKWSLDHGATVVPKEVSLTSDDDRRRDQYGCPPLLESAASQSTVATFELLRSKGAQLSPRTLHFAAREAIWSVHTARGHSERLAMVIHLVDTLKLDPNALDQPIGWSLGNHWGTPLCYVAESNPNWDCSEVVKFLLQRGADPGLVMDPAGWDSVELAKRAKNQQFVELVEDWKAKQAERK